MILIASLCYTFLGKLPSVCCACTLVDYVKVPSILELMINVGNVAEETLFNILNIFFPQNMRLE